MVWYDPLLQRHMLFSGMEEAERRETLAFFNAQERHYEKGVYLNRIAFPLACFGLVLRGTIQVFMDDIQGDQMLMASVGPGETFAESICYLEIDAPVYIRAATDADVLWLNPAALKAQPFSPFAAGLNRRFTAMLARRTLSMNDRIQILSKNTLRGKLMAFFSQYAQKEGASFTVPFDRQHMAIYLGTDRSALSRELSRMRREGIIEYEKNHVSSLRPLPE